MPKVDIPENMRDLMAKAASNAMQELGRRHGCRASEAKNWPGYHILAVVAIEAAVHCLQTAEFDNTQAMKEGWALFEVDGRYQLQRDDEADVFASDADAHIHVALQAHNGSAYHREAMERIGTRVPWAT